MLHNIARGLRRDTLGGAPLDACVCITARCLLMVRSKRVGRVFVGVCSL